MKYSVKADNYHVHFDEHENIRCLEGYFTAKNVDVIFGQIPNSYIYVGMHIFGNNTATSGTIKMVGTLEDAGPATTTVPIMPFSGHRNGLQMFYGQRAVNWYYENHVVATLSFAESIVRLKIDNASVFTGDLYVRLFFRLK